MFKFILPAILSCVQAFFSMTLRCLIIASIVLGLASCKKSDIRHQDNIAKVGVITLKPYEAIQVRELVGRVDQTGIAPLAFEVSGRLANIAIKDGQFVHQGDLIASLEDEPYKLAVQEARAQFNQLSQDLNRRRQLLDEHILSQAAFEELNAQTQMARARLSLAERNLRNTRLLAPFDGRISSRNVELWQFVQAGAVAFNLENSNSVDISVDIPQSMMLQLQPNAELQALGWLPERPDIVIPMHYKEHSTQGPSGTAIFRLIFTAQTPDDLDWLTGMSVRVRLNISPSSPPEVTWRIPMSSLMTNAKGEHFVWRVNEETNSAQAVLVDAKEIIQGDVVVVSEQLTANQNIVNLGAHSVYEGQVLRILEGAK